MSARPQRPSMAGLASRRRLPPPTTHAPSTSQDAARLLQGSGTSHPALGNAVRRGWWALCTTHSTARLTCSNASTDKQGTRCTLPAVAAPRQHLTNNCTQCTTCTTPPVATTFGWAGPSSLLCSPPLTPPRTPLRPPRRGPSCLPITTCTLTRALTPSVTTCRSC